MMVMPPALSFLIPALNEASNIENCIKSIRQYVPAGIDYEIVVGDHGSTDSTAQLATSLGARVAPYHRSTIAEFRNFLIEQSAGDVIVFLDADVYLTPQWGAAIEAALADLRRTPGQLTGSRCAPPPDSDFITRNWFAQIPLEGHAYLGTGHLIFPRSVVAQIGAFDARLRSGEDYDFCMRAKANGLAININPALAVFHHDYPKTLGAFIRREQWHGTGDAQSLRNVIASKVALTAVVFAAAHVALLAGLVLSPAVALVSAIVIVGLSVMTSYIKFPVLSVRQRVANVFLAYCYLVGRSLSLLPVSSNPA